MNKKLIIGIILVIVAIAIAIGAAVIFSSKGEENQNTLTSNEENRNNEVENDIEENTTTNENVANSNQVASSGKTLVAYFSLPETTGDAKEDSTVTVNGEAIRKYTICSKLNSRSYQSRYFQNRSSKTIQHIRPSSINC